MEGGEIGDVGALKGTSTSEGREVEPELVVYEGLGRADQGGHILESSAKYTSIRYTITIEVANPSPRDFTCEVGRAPDIIDIGVGGSVGGFVSEGKIEESTVEHTIKIGSVSQIDAVEKIIGDSGGSVVVSVVIEGILEHISCVSGVGSINSTKEAVRDDGDGGTVGVGREGTIEHS